MGIQHSVIRTASSALASTPHPAAALGRLGSVVLWIANGANTAWKLPRMSIRKGPVGHSWPSFCVALGTKASLLLRFSAPSRLRGESSRSRFNRDDVDIEFCACRVDHDSVRLPWADGVLHHRHSHLATYITILRLRLFYELPTCVFLLPSRRSSPRLPCHPRSAPRTPSHSPACTGAKSVPFAAADPSP